MKFPFPLKAKFSSPMCAPYTSRISDSHTHTHKKKCAKYFTWKSLRIKYILFTKICSRLSKEVPGNDGDRDVLAYMITIAPRYKYKPFI
jgi:hypothetical protein